MAGEILTPLHGAAAIRRTVARLAREIDGDGGGEPLLVVGILKGAFIFLADLVRQVKTPVTVDFATISSYGRGTRPGSLTLLKDVDSPVRGRNVLIVDDIVDAGYTTAFLVDRLRRRRPRSLRVCALLDKPTRRRVPVRIDYLGFTVPDLFIVGYGLDSGERYRQLPGLYLVDGPRS